MGKRRRRDMAATVGATLDDPAPPLKKQSPYSCEPWKPGEVPAGMIFTTRPGGRSVAPWCRQRNGVELPTKRSNPKPDADE